MAESYVDKIAAALGPEQSNAFRRLIGYLGLRDDDPELALACAVSSLLVEIRDLNESVGSNVELFGSVLAQLRDERDSLLAAIRQTIDKQVAESNAAAIDDLAEECRRIGREAAMSEFTTAAVLRTQAISQEVSALSAAAMDLARKEAAGGAPASSSPAGMPSSLQIAVLVVVGFFAGMVMTWLTVFRAHHI